MTTKIKKFKGRPPKPRYSMEVRICIDCENEYPLNEEHFYKDRKGTDGYKMRCKECQRKYDLRKYHEKEKRLSKIFDVNGKSKVPCLPKVEIKQYKIKQWSKDKDLIAVFRCKYCGEIHEIRKLTIKSYNCKCKRNLIYFASINYLWSEILYLSKQMKNDYLLSFDRWK